MSKISVFYKNILAGGLEKTADDNFIFRYDEKYLYSNNPAISLTLPKNEKQFESDRLFPFFDGLIPEGWLLNLASKELRLNPLRDRFELLATLCYDTIGAIHIGEKIVGKEIPSKKSHDEGKIKSFGKCLICYEQTDNIYHDECMIKIFGETINPLVALDESILEELARKQLNQKLAIAGIQKKLSLDLIEDHGKNSRLTVTDLWGRFIFKPKGPPPHLPENEHLCLKLAEASNIKTEKGALIPTSNGELGFIAVRFDRNNNHHEYHQEDFCQILNKEPFKKYSGSVEQVGKILKQFSDFPGDNLYRLFELTLFNFIIGNADAHLKNISLSYESEDGMKILLSPAYDLISTDLYIKNDTEESALTINGKKSRLNQDDFLALAKNLGISAKVYHNIIFKFKTLLPVWEEIIGKSFIQEDKKIELIKLIKKKMQIFV